MPSVFVSAAAVRSTDLICNSAEDHGRHLGAYKYIQAAAGQKPHFAGPSI